MTFILKADYEPYERQYITTSPCKYAWKWMGMIIDVPTGFITNLASIPKSLRPIIPRNGTLWDQAAILHDYVLKQSTFNLSECDWLLFCAMRDLGASWFTCTIFWLAVRTHHKWQ